MAETAQIPFDPPHKPYVAQSDEKYCRQCNSPKENCKCEEVDECPQCGSVYVCSCVIKKKRGRKAKIDNINTPHAKKKKYSNSIGDQLRMANWFIREVGDVDEARRFFDAAAMAYTSLLDPKKEKEKLLKRLAELEAEEKK